MAHSDSGLKSIVADLHALGYLQQDIAMLVGRSQARVCVILTELYPRPPRPTCVDDLPFHMKQRVLLWREQDDANVIPHNVEATTLTS